MVSIHGIGINLKLILNGSMSISGKQCSAARALLGWTSAQLAEAASVGQATVKRFEAGDSVRDTSVGAIRAALEEAGLIFIAAGENTAAGGEGVRRQA